MGGGTELGKNRKVVTNGNVKEERRNEERRSGILEIFGIDILGLVMLYCKESESPLIKIKLFLHLLKNEYILVGYSMKE
jgi:hypothetical protein